MNILAIGAHPDDIEFGCGGTLLKYAKKGNSVSLMILTNGEGGGDRTTRRAEQENSARLMDVATIFWGDCQDTQIGIHQELIQNIENVVRKVEPYFIFVHHHEDTHQDHRHLASCTVSSTRYTRNVLFYEGPTTQNFTPTVFVDIANVLDDKLKCLTAHESQIAKTNIKGLNIVDIAQASAYFRGIQGRVKCAEGFVPLRLFINV